MEEIKSVSGFIAELRNVCAGEPYTAGDLLVMRDAGNELSIHYRVAMQDIPVTIYAEKPRYSDNSSDPVTVMAKGKIKSGSCFVTRLVCDIIDGTFEIPEEIEKLAGIGILFASPGWVRQSEEISFAEYVSAEMMAGVDAEKARMDKKGKRLDGRKRVINGHFVDVSCKRDPHKTGIERMRELVRGYFTFSQLMNSCAS